MERLKFKLFSFYILIFLIVSACTQEAIMPKKVDEEVNKKQDATRKNSSARTGCSTVGVFSSNFTVTQIQDVVYNSWSGARVTSYMLELTQIQGDMTGDFYIQTGNYPAGTNAEISSVYYSYDEDLNNNGVIESNEVIEVSNASSFQFRLGTLCHSFSKKLRIRFKVTAYGNRAWTPTFQLKSDFGGTYPAYFGTIFSGHSSSVVTAPPIHVGYTYVNANERTAAGTMYAVAGGALYKVASENRTLMTYMDMSGVEGIAATQNYIFYAKNGNLWRHSTNSPNGSGQYFTSLGSGWVNVEAMCADQYNVYTVQNGTLYKTAENGSTTMINSGWNGIEALANAPGTNYLYGIQGGKLWRQNKSNATYAAIGSGTWWGVEAMLYSSFDNFIYLVHADKLKKVNPSNGATTIVESYGWSGVKGLVDGGHQYIYGMQGGHLWRTQKTGGSTSIGPADWGSAEHFIIWSTW